MGCGRLFEGTPQQMWSSLSKIAALPPQTWVFCAHEYTQANTKWAQVHIWWPFSAAQPSTQGQC
jgi:hydroxyacylglutathione hydrolase